MVIKSGGMTPGGELMKRKVLCHVRMEPCWLILWFGSTGILEGHERVRFTPSQHLASEEHARAALHSLLQQLAVPAL